MSTVSPDSKRDKIRQVETFPQPRNAKRQLPKPPAHRSPLPSAREKGGWPRRGWKRKAVIKPPFPRLNHPSLGACTPLVPFHSRRNSCHLLPAGWRDPKLHAAAPRVEVLGMLSLPGVHLSLPQTAQGRGEQGEISMAQIPQAHHTSEQAGEDRAPACHRVDVQHRGTVTVLYKPSTMALAQLLPTLTVVFDSGNTQAASNTLLCSLANLHPESMSTQVRQSY